MSLPYSETGYFSPEKPDAAGYALVVRRGEKIIVQVSVKLPGDILPFTDLWRRRRIIRRLTSRLRTTLRAALKHEASGDGRPVLRLQP